MKTFRHSGKLGDIIYSLPCISALTDKAILYIPERTHDDCEHLYSFIKPLLELQPYVQEVRLYPDVKQYNEPLTFPVDYDLDQARYQPLLGRTHIIRRYLDAFATSLAKWEKPWINGIPVQTGNYTVINWTGRHLNNKTGKGAVDWAKVVSRINNDIVFIGTQEEHQRFIKRYTFVPYLQVRNALAAALYVAGAKNVYCNQSFILTLAQGLGKEYWLEVKYGKTNCLLRTPNEHILI